MYEEAKTHTVLTMPFLIILVSQNLACGLLCGLHQGLQQQSGSGGAIAIFAVVLSLKTLMALYILIIRSHVSAVIS
jgi:hypothetical protein